MEFVEIMDPAYNSVCILKLLLVHALRHGLVKGATSWDSMMANLRVTKLIQWTHPLRPVVCASFRGTSGKVDLDKPATTGLFLRCLRQGADAIGMLRIPIMHDLRRGAAHEQVHLTDTLRPTAMEGARHLLSHSATAKNNGVTLQYTGHVAEATWSKRLETPVVQRARHVVDLAPASYKNKRLAPDTVEEFCQSNGLDPRNKRHRAQAAERIHINQRNEWANAALAQSDTPAPQAGPSRPLARETTTSMTPSAPSSAAVPRNPTPEKVYGAQPSSRLTRGTKIREPLGPLDPNAALKPSPGKAKPVKGPGSQDKSHFTHAFEEIDRSIDPNADYVPVDETTEEEALGDETSTFQTISFDTLVGNDSNLQAAFIAVPSSRRLDRVKSSLGHLWRPKRIRIVAFQDQRRQMGQEWLLGPPRLCCRRRKPRSRHPLRLQMRREGLRKGVPHEGHL